MNTFSFSGIYYKKNVGKYINFDVYYIIIKNEMDINPSYDNKHKANTKAFTNADPNATHTVTIISIFDKVKK